jgi:integrase
MPRKFPKPFFRRDRGRDRGWFVQIGKQQIKLGDGPENSATEAAALKRYHEIMAEGGRDKPANSATSPNGPAVADILDKFLNWTLNNKAPRTFEWYQDHLQAFLNHLGTKASMPVSELRPFHVIEWLDKHPGWSATYQRGAIVAVQRPFNWAEELGYLSASPIKKIKKPQPERRESHVTGDEFSDIIGNYEEGDPFRDLLLFAWHCGCRPQEATHIEARHVHLDVESIIIPKEESKGKRRVRVIHLQGQALDIIRRLVAGHPNGKLFVNEDGKPWKRFAIANRFDRLHLNNGIARLKELGIEVEPLPRFNRREYQCQAELLVARKEHQIQLRDRRKRILKLAREHGAKTALYGLRHGFCQRMLESGANHLAVAELMGHSTGRMVAETYSHMNKASTHLKETLRKANASA